MIFQFGLDSRRRLTREEVAELYQRTGWLVFRRSCFLLRDEKEAQDVLQDVFVRVMRYGGPSGNRQVELSFLYRTAERCCFDRMRKRKQEPVGLPDNFEEFLSLSTEKRDEAAEMIVPFLNRLKPQLRQMALLYFLDDLSQEQIAEQLLMSRRTVGKRLKEIDQKAKLWAQRSRGK